MVVISFVPNGAWAGRGADFPTACALGYGLSPALRAYHICDESTRDTRRSTRIKICAVTTGSEDCKRSLPSARVQ
jgi:hypothetical protein